MNYASTCPFFLVLLYLYPYMSIQMKPTTRSLNVLLILWSLFSLFMAGYGAESDIQCLQTIKKLDPFNHLSSWEFESNTEANICGFNGVECWNDMDHSVSSILLSNKGLKGQFPQCIENFTWLKNLNLSHNELSGEIPKGVAFLYELTTLRLEGNQLSGQIPKELGLLVYLMDFSVANNLLEGPVPVFVSNLDVSLSYANNSGLCGGALGTCKESLFGSSFWYSFIVSFVSSATSVLLVSMDYYKPWTVFRKGRSNPIHPLRKKQNHQKDIRQGAQLIPLALQKQGSKELARLLEKLIPRMSYKELCKATGYFNTDNILGLGMTGIMYKAKVANNCFVAVKRLYDGDRYKREFLHEAMIPGRHRHRNIAPLVGFCIEEKERILVYKYMSNGRLSDWLHSSDERHQTNLEWPVRIHIALGLARGLSWLYERCKIIHQRLDSECVLLDKNFEPKISNFGKAKFHNQTVEDHVRMKLFLIGEPGVKISVEKDVYDFGIILFELITGKRLSPTSDSSFDSVNDLMKCINKNLFSGPADFYDVIDKCIIGKGFDDKILGLLQVACDCVKVSFKERPKMADMHKTVGAIWEGYNPLFDSERLNLSMDCPNHIPCTSEIECIY